MGEKITDCDGEVIAEIIDYYDDSGGYLGTGLRVAPEKGYLELLLMLWLPVAIIMWMLIWEWA